jgi:hypothetical protein
MQLLDFASRQANAAADRHRGCNRADNSGSDICGCSHHKKTRGKCDFSGYCLHPAFEKRNTSTTAVKRCLPPSQRGPPSYRKQAGNLVFLRAEWSKGNGQQHGASDRHVV